MKIKNLNVAKLKDVIIQDKKISAIYSRLKSVLSKHKQNNSFAVAVSGGPDSMALAFLSNLLNYYMEDSQNFYLSTLSSIHPKLEGETDTGRTNLHIYLCQRGATRKNSLPYTPHSRTREGV